MERKSKICAICSDIPHKYKCPSCGIPYCSVPCYRKHQETPCQKSQEVEKPCESHSKATILFPTEDTVPEERLTMLSDSDAVKTLLRNPHLRQLLQELDAAPNAEKAMRVAMQEPLFTEFADEVLKIVEPQQKENCT